MKNIKNTTCEEIEEREEIFYKLEDEFSKKDSKRTKRNYHDSLKVINRKKLDKSKNKPNFSMKYVNTVFEENMVNIKNKPEYIHSDEFEDKVIELETETYYDKVDNSSKINGIYELERLKTIYELLKAIKEQRNLSDSIEYREYVNKYILGKSSKKVNRYMNKVIDRELHILSLKKKISE